MDLNFILLIQALENERQGRQHRLAKRQLRDASNPLEHPEGIFKKMYRLSRATAHFLIEEISPFLQEQVREEIALPNNLIVLCALHFYGQGSYQKSVGQDMNIPICQSSVSKCIDVVTNVLNEHFSHLIKFPTSEAEKNIQKRKFMELPNGFPGIIGAIDCTHIKIHPPKIEDEQYPGILFYNRKGYYSINAQCIVGADLKLLALNARYPGSVHDSAIWSTSHIRTHLIQNFQHGDRNSWLIGDGGYPLEPWLMTPVGRVQTQEERSYNVAHRSNRNVVERFNGVMKAVFRCCFAERTLHYAPEKAAKIINACGILYNVRMEHIDFEEGEVEGEQDDLDDNNNNNRDNPQWLNEGRQIRQRLINNYF